MFHKRGVWNHGRRPTAPQLTEPFHKRICSAYRPRIILGELSACDAVARPPAANQVVMQAITMEILMKLPVRSEAQKEPGAREGI